MTGAELLSYIRVDVLHDAAVPYLWSDALIYRHLTEAQKIHARKTYSIVDDTPTIDTVADTASYALAAGTIYVLSARVSTSSRDLRNYTHKAIPSHLLTSTGEPQIYTMDEATGKVRFYPVPDAVYTVNLRVARLPASSVVSYAAPEILEEYHMDLSEYVAWQCLRMPDDDGENAKAAKDHKDEWAARVLEAKREFYRRQLGNDPSVVSSWTGKRN